MFIIASVSRTLCKFYSHFLDDKRLDEWVGDDRFLGKAEAEAYLAEKGSESVLTSSGSSSTLGGGAMERTLTRTLRRKFEESHQGTRRPFEDPVIEQLEQEHELATKVKNIQKIEIGRYEIDCWYFSPYPDAYSQADKLFMCEGCLKYMRFVKTLVDHRKQCKQSAPPGKLIYRKADLAVFELDGEEQKLYCQNLCLLAKLFLDHKTLYYDVSPFMFYVLCEVDAEGTHPVGYFSKEKASPDNYNLACIMILPPHQRKGYGRFLIQLSYEITKRQGITGSPEKPLSDLGLVSYRSFWTFELLQRLRAVKPGVILSLKDLMELTGFQREDIIDTLARLNLLTVWRGEPALNYSAKAVDEHLKAFSGKKFTLMDPKSLKWP
jgi:histone acetyltransferase MYST1